MKNNMLTCKNISKTFGATVAVNNASVDFRKGEIRGLIGENGSGKTTLSSIIAGIIKCDSGTMELEGKPYKPSTPIDASRQGISMIVQEMSTMDNLTIAQNIFLGYEKQYSKAGILNTKKMNSDAKSLMKKYGLEGIDAHADISDLSFEQRKLLEFAKALNTQPDLLIVDETTTALSQHGRQMLYDIMHELKNNGKTVVFITHDLFELFDHCDSATIMKDGEIVGTYDIKELDESRIKALMVGREFQQSGKYYREDKTSSYSNEVIFRASGLKKGCVFQDINFELHRGEILGIGGLTGCGMHELGQSLFGIQQPDMGTVTLIRNGKEAVVSSARMAIKNKVAYVSKNRDQEGLMLASSISDNIALPGISALSKLTFISPQKRKRYAEDNTKQLSVKMHNVNQLVMHLSGGNKQKVTLSRWIANNSEVFILDCPTRGIDISVKAAVYHLMQEFKEQGRSVIMISEELLELIGMCDRIMMMKNGRIAGLVTRGEDVTEEYLINYMI